MELLADQRVVEVKKLHTTVDSQQQSVSSVVLTFTLKKLPDKIKLVWDSFVVSPYIPRPTRYYRQQQYGHNPGSCGTKTPICSGCATLGHSHQNCTKKHKKLSACGGPHDSSSSSCPVWKEECEVTKVKTTKMLTCSANRRGLMSTKDVCPALPPPHREQNSTTDDIPASANQLDPDWQPASKKKRKMKSKADHWKKED